MKRTWKAPVCCLAVVVLCGFSAAQVTFKQIAINSGDTTSNGITSGDFNNDGILDLVTVNAQTLSFYKGLGNGKYAAPVNQSLPQNLGQVVAADFNRDGALDLAIAQGCCSGSGGVVILFGNRNGTFRQGTNINVEGNNAVNIALADFNGDHLSDLAVSSYLGHTEVFTGNGDGTFKQSALIEDGGVQAVAGDFNADGHQDLAMTGGGNVALYFGNGDGTFKSSPAVANVNNVSFLAVGDFFNNRIQSLAVLTNDYDGAGDWAEDLYTLRYFNGQLQVANSMVITPSTGDPFWQLVGGDLNGDFKDDLFLAGGDFQGGAVSGYMIGNGDGSFQGPFSAPTYMDLQWYPFIRDLNLDSRHDVGMAWTSIFDSIGGEEMLWNTSSAQNCGPPKANPLHVHICAPTNGQAVGKTFTFRAAGNAFNGVAKRMELWIDGRKVGQNLEDQLRVTTNLPRGAHTASFVVVNTFDQFVSKSVSFTSSY
ncbi:MAG TPA: FG-GAP-like repeat-containing protein [Candidatus Eisenbacteria bacterium]|nr:FG-GAP-like repeat-containing protein [Candidatus Eisenbacteria bacterium]